MGIKIFIFWMVVIVIFFLFLKNIDKFFKLSLAILAIAIVVAFVIYTDWGVLLDRLGFLTEK